MCVQLDGVDILCLTVSTVELTLTLLEVPSLAVVALVLESEGSSHCSQGIATEMSGILLLWLSTSKPACVLMLVIFQFACVEVYSGEPSQVGVCEVTYLLVFLSGG